MGSNFFPPGGRGGVLALIIILSLCEGGVEINFCLIRERYDLVLGHISSISQPPPSR